MDYIKELRGLNESRSMNRAQKEQGLKRVGEALRLDVESATARGDNKDVEKLMPFVEAYYSATKEFAANPDGRASNVPPGFLGVMGNAGTEPPTNAGTMPGRKNFAPSPRDASAEVWRELHDAAVHRKGFRAEIGTKTAFTVGGMSPGLPPQLLPGLTQPLPYEPDRLFDHIPAATMSGPSVEYLVHTGNTNPAAAVAELGTKPDLGMQLSAKIAYPVKIAALASFSMESLHDFETFLTFVPAEMQRAVIDAESDQLVNGNGTAPNMLGILATSSVLTRAYPTSPATNETGLDTLELAVNDIRVGPAFARADLFVMSPGTYSALRRLKDTLGRFLLEDDIKQPGAATIWGVPVVQTTKIANGTVIVADSSALMGWTRMGLTVETNGYGDTEWTTNAVSFRCEERIALGVLRPKAVNIVTGIPADTTSTT